MANKIVRYTLTPEGTIPEEIQQGGFTTKENGGTSPQDWDYVGCTKDGSSFKGLEEYTSKAKLLTYLKTIGPWEEGDDIDEDGNVVREGETVTPEQMAEEIWSLKK